MGQCMQTSIVSSKVHPTLGSLLHLQQGNTKLFTLTCPLLNEEQYIFWSKTINKLRYSSDITSYLYLPLREKFNESQVMCDSMSRLELVFEPFHETVREALVKNISLHRYFHESYLWYLLYVVSRYLQHCEKTDHHPANFTLDSLLIFSDGSLKVIPDNILPNQEQASTLYPELDDCQEGSTQHSRISTPKIGEPLSTIQTTGVMMLCIADLIHPSLYFEKGQQSWRSLGEQSKREAIKNCERRYSPLMVQTLLELNQKSKERRITLNSLCKRLEAFEGQILARREAGIGPNLAQSAVESIKTSYCVENKTVVNSSNLFRVSAVENESGVGSSLSGKKSMEGVTWKEDYLDIL